MLAVAAYVFAPAYSLFAGLSSFISACCLPCRAPLSSSNRASVSVHFISGALASFPAANRCKTKQPEKEGRRNKMGSETFLEILLAILLPPVGVFLRYGIGVEFWICLLLTILGYIPGIIYAVYILVA